MKLNFSQPYGTIMGHEVAHYEQNGILFDGAGNPIGGELAAAKKPAKPAPAAVSPDKYVANAQQFLNTLLTGGPIDKSVVFKEAEGNNQKWEHVKAAFALIGKEIKRGNTTLWALNLEAARPQKTA